MEIKKTETEREGKIIGEQRLTSRERKGGTVMEALRVKERERHREREWVIVCDRRKEREEHLHNVLHRRKSLRLAVLDN